MYSRFRFLLSHILDVLFLLLSHLFAFDLSIHCSIKERQVRSGYFVVNYFEFVEVYVLHLFDLNLNEVVLDFELKLLLQFVIVLILVREEEADVKGLVVVDGEYLF